PRRGVSPAARALPRATRDHARHRHLPHSRPRWAPRRVRPVRVRAPGVQLLPQSPLPEVRGLARGALDRGAHGPPRAEPLLPRRLHPARHAPPAGPAQPPTALHAAVPRRHADAPPRRPRSRPAGGPPRRAPRAAPLAPRPPFPSPPPRLRPLQGSALPPGLDRLRQAPLRGPAPALPLPRPLHASRRTLQSPPARRHGHQCALRDQARARRHARPRGVHPPLPAPRPTPWLRQDPSLRSLRAGPGGVPRPRARPPPARRHPG